ncbi:MAG: DsbA family protein [Pseudomonadota bacterium]
MPHSLSHWLKRGVAAAGLALAFSATSLPANALDDAEKKQVEEIIRNYILENPEILLEAQQALEAKRVAAQKEKARKALTERADVIYASTNQFDLGNKNGDVTIVEFFDYNCGFCQRAMNDMNRLLDGDKNLRFVLKELPILSEASVEAHRVSTAVGRVAPKKYAEYHQRLLSAPGRKDGARALQIAVEMGIDTQKVAALAQDESVTDAFREVNQLATELGMTGTPSYVIGDEVVFGALGYDVLKAKIDNVRKCGKATC